MLTILYVTWSFHPPTPDYHAALFHHQLVRFQKVRDQVPLRIYLMVMYFWCCMALRMYVIHLSTRTVQCIH